MAELTELRDDYGRRLNYVRISVTDRCNYRCAYCMPPEGVKCLSHEDILRYEDIKFLCRVFVELGVGKFRFTGGEPLVRKMCIRDSYRRDEEWITELPKGGDLPWALFYPADYSIGSANLGFHYVFQRLRESGVAAERFFASPVPYRSVDADTMLERFSVITASVAYEGDIPAFYRWLSGANIPLLAE